jgi:hypothetical protein
MKHIYNAELFTRNGRFVVQWLERTDDKQWTRRGAYVSQNAANKLRRMDNFQQLEWIAKRLPEPVETEQPEDVP